MTKSELLPVVYISPHYIAGTDNTAKLTGGVGRVLGLIIVSQSVLKVIILRKRNTKLRIQKRLIGRRN